MFSEDYNFTVGRSWVSGEWIDLDDEQRARHAYQLEPKLLKAIFGNVGTIAAFAVGLQDAERLATAFDDLNPSVLSSASRGQFVVQTRRGGSLLSPIFVAGEVMDWSLGSLSKSRRLTRNIYGRNRTRPDVESRIEKWYL